MGIIKKYIRKLDVVSDNLDNVAIEAVRENEDFILDLLKNKQLGEGKDSFGEIVGRYKKSTIKKWIPKDPPRTIKKTGQPYNFDWHGRFKDTMSVKTDKSGYVIDSATKRALEAIYDTKLTKLSKENSILIDEKIIAPALYESIFNAIT